MKKVIGSVSLILAGSFLTSCSSSHNAMKSNDNVASMSSESSKGSLDDKIASWPARPLQ
jgi:hypothetical protein